MSRPENDLLTLEQLARSLWMQGTSARCIHCGQHYTGNHSWYRYEVKGGLRMPKPGAFRLELQRGEGPLCAYCFSLELNRLDDALEGK